MLGDERIQLFMFCSVLLSKETRQDPGAIKLAWQKLNKHKTSLIEKVILIVNAKWKIPIRVEMGIVIENAKCNFPYKIIIIYDNFLGDK